MENIRMDLRLFDANTQVTTQQSLTEEMKTFYSDYLIDAAEPELVHDQFAQKHPIPANGGKTIQFRRFAPLGKALTALTEGVTPDGQSLSMSTVEAAVRQYGGYIQMSDLLLLTAIDNNLTMATKLLGAQAGRTLDTITREVLVGGDNVQYADESVSARYLLRGGQCRRCRQQLPDRRLHPPRRARTQKRQLPPHRRRVPGHHPPRRGIRPHERPEMARAAPVRGHGAYV